MFRDKEYNTASRLHHLSPSISCINKNCRGGGLKGPAKQQRVKKTNKPTKRSQQDVDLCLLLTVHKIGMSVNHSNGPGQRPACNICVTQLRQTLKQLSNAPQKDFGTFASTWALRLVRLRLRTTEARRSPWASQAPSKMQNPRCVARISAGCRARTRAGKAVTTTQHAPF